ncbi:SRPBCC family protein [Jongsikchunia kroppenstedtii]|uniref:SRPBCC family protein n=1 Tax=Jongsikchunia kroppenstedtii TaxID=1121721 RepID=UPI0005BA8C4D|nr:SRPBCC family protein [Jongsikchunia kroppenstedtii]
MTIVSISTELPLSAHRARALAAVPEVMLFVLAPVLSFAMDEAPEPGTAVEPGFRARGRVRWLGVIPSWTHEIEVVRLDENEIYTREHGGPVHTWNHRLTFEPVGADSCRYTDEIEIDGGVTGWLTGLFVRAMFRHRHRRWQTLAALVRALPA